MIDDESIEKLRKGIRLDRTITAPAKVRRWRKIENNSWLEMVIYEGKKRQIRRMLERVGHSVIRLMRIRINGIEMGALRPGECRQISSEEMRILEKELSMDGVL